MPGTGAGDIAHIYLLELGPSIQHEEVEFITYDDATQQLLVVKGGHVFAYDVSKGPANDSSLKWMYPLQEGPAVIALRPSLDNRMLAVQRSAAMLELVDLASGLCFVHSIHKGRGDILAFFFTDAPDTDMVVVTSRAVEFTQFAARRQGLRCRDRVRCSNAWALYTHETRMVLIGSAVPPHSALAAWQFASHGITQLPLFELQGPLPASAAVRQFLPAQSPYQQQPLPTPAAAPLPAAAPSQLMRLGAVAAGTASAMPTAQQQQQQDRGGAAGSAAGHAHRNLAPERIWLLKMYGRVYLALADTAGNRLELYRFYTDTIILQHVYELVSPEVHLSVVDNTLVVHHPGTSVVMLYDVALALPGTSQLANPLPLRRLQLLPPALAAAAASAEPMQGCPSQQEQQQGSAGAAADDDAANSSTLSRASSRTLLVPAASSSNTAAGIAAGEAAAAAAAGNVDGDVYEASEAPHAASWRYFMPGVILDVASKAVGRMQLDLQAIADSAGDWPALVGFLQRRHELPADAPLAAQPRQLLVGVARAALTERLSLNTVRLIFDRLLQAYADAMARAAASNGNGAALRGAAAPGSAVAAAAPASAAPASATGSGSAAAAAAVGAGLPVPLLAVPAVTVITPHELARELFQWVHDEEVVDALYLQAVVSEYCAASDAVSVVPPAYLQLLAVDLLLQQEQHYQAVQLLYSQPSTGSSQLAQHLLEVASSKDGGVGLAAAAAAAGVDRHVDVMGMSPSSAAGGVAAAASDAAAGLAAPLLPRQSVYDSSPGAAMALALAMDVMARQTVPELRASGTSAAAAAAGSAAAAGGGAGAGGKACTAALVRQLLSTGQVLQAARLARTAGGVAAIGVPASAFLQVAAATGDAGAFAAVYRVMRPHLVGTWPDFNSASAHFWGTTAA